MTTTSHTHLGAASHSALLLGNLDTPVGSPRNWAWAGGPLAIGTRWLVWLLVAGCAGTFADAADTVAANLRQAATARARWVAENTPANGQEFTRATQAAADAFTKVELKESGSTERFVRVTLNQHGAGFDGIRFTVPKGEPRDLVWGFAALQRNIPSNWYNLARTGEMKGFTQFFRGGPGMKDVPWEESVIPYEVYLQPLAGGELKPEQEYLIWFLFSDPRPKDLYVMLKLVPVGTPINSVATVHAQLGLSYRPTTK
ncbi:MAG: hypothetical protein RL514_548 [Verrucomicrobiota bacterium]|jgi:hypothetical protein